VGTVYAKTGYSGICRKKDIVDYTFREYGSGG
jgi:hypothetical protein